MNNKKTIKNILLILLLVIFVFIILRINNFLKFFGFEINSNNNHILKNKNDVIEYVENEHPSENYEIVKGPIYDSTDKNLCFYYIVKSKSDGVTFKVYEKYESDSGGLTTSHNVYDNYEKEYNKYFIKKYNEKHNKNLKSIDKYDVEIDAKDYYSSEEIVEERYSLFNEYRLNPKICDNKSILKNCNISIFINYEDGHQSTSVSSNYYKTKEEIRNELNKE